ncbi:MAG: glycosyltransferase family 39 protein [Anaerolineales bacterium]|nr:glycosyltransferase family 39 protein [Anaerolineales bacterium]
MTIISEQKSFFSQRKWATWFVPLFIIGLGLLLRFVDLTDPPLDFNPTRQLRAAIIARGIYYSHLEDFPLENKPNAIRFADQMSVYEPTIFEHLVAWTYLLVGDEKLWIARIIAILFWCIGSIGLFGLANEIFGVDGAIVALGFYQFLPFGVFASRAFQPDPLMVVGIIFTTWALYRWSLTRAWIYAVWTGLIGGFTILIKAGGVFFIGAMVIAVILTGRGLRKNIADKKIWVIAGLIIVQPAIYYLMTIGKKSASLFTNWTLVLAHLWLSPSFYMRWLIRLDSLIGLFVFFLGLIGVILIKGKAKPLLIGYWFGYGLFGLAFPHQITTHDYYHLALIPLLALSLASIGKILFSKAVSLEKIWQVVLAGVLIIGITYPIWMARSILVGQDYRAEPVFWKQVGEAIPADGKAIALSQDYGHRLMYYGWRKVSCFPNSAQQNLSELRGNTGKDFYEMFQEKTKGYDYFVVTSLNQLNKQPLLKSILQENYPALKQGDGFVIYDLRHPVKD